MRKLLKTATLLTAFMMCFTLCGCDINETSKSDNKTTENIQSKNEQNEEKTKDNSSESSTKSDDVDTDEKNDSSPIYEDDIVKIIYNGIEESMFGTDVKLSLENLSDKSIMVQVRDVSVNGVMADSAFSCDISAGKKANDSISFYNLEENGIDNVETIELSFCVIDSDNFETFVETEPITINVQ